MTIDLTDGANAGWMSFRVFYEGENDEGRKLLRVTRGKNDAARFAIAHDGSEATRVIEIERTETVEDGWIVAAGEFLYDQVLVPSDEDADAFSEIGEIDADAATFGEIGPIYVSAEGDGDGTADLAAAAAGEGYVSGTANEVEATKQDTNETDGGESEKSS